MKGNAKLGSCIFVMLCIAALLTSCDPPHIETPMHTVIFDANGGEWSSGTEISVDIPDNAPIWDYRPEVPVRSGYNFSGWFTDKEATNPYDPNSLVVSDLSLYAGWAEKHIPVYRIEFDTEGGSFLAPQLVASGNQARRPEDPKKDGYAFEGWSATGDSSDLFSFSTPITGSMTLHAIWKEAWSISFSYDLPSSLGSEASLSALPDTMMIPDGETIGSLPSVSLSYNNTEFRFLGWFEEGSDTPFDDEEKITDNITLHGHWEEYALSASGEYITYSEEGLLEWAASGISSCSLIADITLKDEWSPIGSENAPYSAVFNGNGHTVSGLRVDGTEGHIGFFGYIGQNGSVLGLKLEGASLTGSEASGGIAGENLGRIEDCHVSGTIEGSGIAEGGIAGRNRGTISECTASVESAGNGDAGGIAGINYGLIKDSGSDGTIRGEYAIGGIAGLNADGGRISGCTFSGEVIDGYYAGGIAGCNDNKSIIEKCSFTGRINDMDWYIGGIAGLNSLESIIQECASSGAIIGHDETGGITGYNFAAYIYACSFSGSVYSDTIAGGIAGISMGPLAACYSSGTVKCGSTAGGITGINRFHKMISCYSTGSVNGNDTIGGITGLNENAEITACFWENGGDIPGVGRSLSSGDLDVIKIGDGNSWETALSEMNTALAEYGYEYAENTGPDAGGFPLIAVSK